MNKVHFIVNQVTKTGFKFYNRKDMEAISKYIIDFDEQFETYSLELTVKEDGCIFIKDTAHDDLVNDIFIGKLDEKIMKKTMEYAIGKAISALTVRPDELGMGYEFAVVA